MKTLHRFRLPIVSISVVASLISASGRASVAITEFPIPTADRNPQEIVVGSDGNLWFTEGTPDGGIGRITPSGVITEFPVAPSQNVPYLGPITAGSDGALYFRSKSSLAIDRMTPDGQVTETGIPNVGPEELTLGPDGHVWMSGCSSIAQFSGDGVKNFELPLSLTNDIDFCTVDGEAVGITTGADGNLWFAMDGGPTSASRGQIGKITLSGQITLFDAGGNNPYEIAAGPDGNLWFTDARHSAIGRSTLSGGITMYPIPSGNYARYITAGPDGNLWFTDGADRIGQITPSGEISEFSLPAGSGPSGITVGPDHAIWFTESGSNKIGRLDLDAVGSCFPDAQTLCLGIFRVTASWEGSGQGGTGNGLSITPIAGYFWFSDPSNLEVLVKILDFCPSTGHFGIYVNGLTHLGVTVTVTDTRTGTSKDYVNADGSPFSLIFDGSTFECP
jgi:streptogramin lyase